MNFSFFSRFSTTSQINKILQTISVIKGHSMFKGARLDVYTPTTEPTKLIVVLGQIHTVWKGKIGNRERKKIVNCQAQLCGYYAYFEQFLQVKQFGGEGVYEGLDVNSASSVVNELYQKTSQKLQVSDQIPVEQLAEISVRILKELGAEWQRLLRLQIDIKKIQTYAAAVSGQNLFNFLNHGQIRVYAIEGERAYQHVLQNINQLGQKITQIEEKYEYKVVRQRGGQVKDEKELEVIQQYNALVKEFNQLIGSDIRERATMDILKQKTARHDLVIFTMGIGHRQNYRRLADEYLKNTSTAFVFITPPVLLTNWWMMIGLPVLILVVLIVIEAALISS